MLDITASIIYDQSHNNFAPIQDIGMASTFDDTLLTPLEVLDAVPPDQIIGLNIDFDVTTDGINRGMFNDLPYLSPKTPTLNTLLAQGNYSLSTEVYGPQTIASVLNHLNMIQVNLNNKDGNAHPCKYFKCTRDGSEILNFFCC